MKGLQLAISKIAKVLSLVENASSTGKSTIQFRLVILTGLLAQLNTFESYFRNSLEHFDSNSLYDLSLVVTQFHLNPQVDGGFPEYKDTLQKWILLVAFDDGRNRSIFSF